MISSKNRKIVTYSLLALVILSVFISGVIFPPFHGYYTTDENFVADSGVWMWYGNTPRGLDWPASPSMLFYFIIFGVACFKSIIANSGSIHGLVSIFESFDLEAYKYLWDREPYILLGRAFQILIVGYILYKTIRLIHKRNHFLLTDSLRLFLPVVLVASTILFANLPVLRPEAISGSVFILLLARLVFTDSISIKDVVICSILFGLILAQRLIFAFFIPFYIAAVFLLVPQDKIKNVLFSLLVIFVSFIVFCPFIISDTLVVMKSFVGGIIAKMNDKPMGTFFNMEYLKIYFAEPVNYIILALSIIGIVKLLRTKKVIYYVLIGNLLLFLFLVLRSSKIYDTHVLPAGVVTLFLIGLGLSYIVELGKKWGFKVALGLVIIISLFHFNEAYAQHKRVHATVNMHTASNWILTLPSGTKMLLNPELEFYIPKTQECLLREKTQNLDTLKMIKKLNFLLGNKGAAELSEENLPIIANAFAFEDEKQYDAQYRILLKYVSTEKRKMFDYDIYFDSIELASHSVQTEEAINEFKAGKYLYMVTDLQLQGIKPIKIFNKDEGAYYYVYDSRIK
ncbi:hypothetical protein [Dyadobacter sp. CY356]|uniref:hypothetical protein n=1 Tax=Dyadobacter sp. CY356 TaxID=2906442 RepID=UPI001F41C3BD|nr:hypothetical protein [Dyadobacter sp. CY356]MCF0055701.1 hypothetical protein [Dyadobacter sp. CY356]